MYKDTTRVIAHELLITLSRFSEQDTTYIISEYLRNGKVVSYNLTITDVALLEAMSTRYRVARRSQPLDYFGIGINFPCVEIIAWRDLDIP
jgi:hypothetical protein